MFSGWPGSQERFGDLNHSKMQEKQHSLVELNIPSSDFLTSIGSSSLRTLTSPIPHFYLQITESKRQTKNHPGYKYHKSNYKLLIILSMLKYLFFFLTQNASGEVEATSNMVENSHIPDGKKTWKSL